MRNDMARVYKLKDGDIFTISIRCLTPDVLNNPHLTVTAIQHVRAWWTIKLCGRYRRIPKPYKIYLFQFQFHKEK